MIFFKIIILRSTLTHASIRYYYNMLPIYQPIQAVNGFRPMFIYMLFYNYHMNSCTSTPQYQ